MNRRLQQTDRREFSTADARQSPATIPSSVPVPDAQDAATLGTIIDYGRLALGWNRLPEPEQDAMVCAFYLDLTDAGVPSERWMDCYRAWKARRRLAAKEGRQVGALSADDLILEWDSLKHMHAELDKTRLLPETAATVCPRCDGTGLERMPDNSRRPGCKHEFADEETAAHIIERDAETVKAKAAEMREQLARMATVKAMPKVSFTDNLTITYTCTECRRKESSEFGWAFNDPCGARLFGPVREGERLACPGVMKVLWRPAPERKRYDRHPSKRRWQLKFSP